MSKVTSIRPEPYTAREWTDRMALDLWRFGPIPRIQNESEWRDWGAALLALPSIHGILLPDPYQFSDWRRWAERVNEAFASIQF